MAAKRSVQNSQMPNGISNIISLPNGGKVLCIAEIRGRLDLINQLAQEHGASYVIHTGDFGFYDANSIDRMTEQTLRHVVQYSALRTPQQRNNPAYSYSNSNPLSTLRQSVKSCPEVISQFPLLRSSTIKFIVPVYTVAGACEDVQILEELRANPELIHNLFLLDEHQSTLIHVGGLKIRLLGLGGALVMHKLFDNGEGRTTIAGGGGIIWTTALQMGEMLETGMACWDRSEVRIFVTSASIGRDGLLSQMALALRADFTISAGLHLRYLSTYNDYSVYPHLDHYRGKLAASKKAFDDVWQTVKVEVEKLISESSQKRLLRNVLDVVAMMPDSANVYEENLQYATKDREELSLKNTWHINLSDIAFGHAILNVNERSINIQTFSQGANFAYRLEDIKSKSVSGHKSSKFFSSKDERKSTSGSPQQVRKVDDFAERTDVKDPASLDSAKSKLDKASPEENYSGDALRRAPSTTTHNKPHHQAFATDRTLYFNEIADLEAVLQDLKSHITGRRNLAGGKALVEFDTKQNMEAALKTLNEVKPNWGVKEARKPQYQNSRGGRGGSMFRGRRSSGPPSARNNRRDSGGVDKSDKQSRPAGGGDQQPSSASINGPPPTVKA